MKYKVIIPELKCSVIEFVQDGFPGVAFVNIALRNFEPKAVFAWHLSIMIDLEDLIENGMPSKKEREVIEKFESQLDSLLIGSNVKNPNAVFLARITCNGTRELIWRIYDPEEANSVLKRIIGEDESPRQFDYRMDDDKKWELAEWSLKEYGK